MTERTRLVDYVVIAGYDHKRGRRDIGQNDSINSNNDRAFQCQGIILQRFPTQDWSDAPFTEGLEHFCQPSGWNLHYERQEPKFFIAGLTDCNGSRKYCAVLSFSEAVAKEDLETDYQYAPDEVDDSTTADNFTSLVSTGVLTSRSTSLPRHVVPGVSLPTIANDCLLFAPKCIVLVSKHDFSDVLRNCLTVIYTAYSECLVGAGGERIKLETLVGNLLGSVYVPSPNAPQLQFSLGAGDKLCLQPLVHEHVPRTGTKVAMLFKQLGISNVLTLFTAAITEVKILLYSKSFMRLSDACTALTSLLYPLQYSHVFIPVLPSALLDVLAAPTPFIIGVNSIHEEYINDTVMDVVKVDLDGGTILISENMKIHQLPNYMYAKVTDELTMILQPELHTADNAFFSDKTEQSNVSKKPFSILDKELRAVMLRLMTHILEGYRSYLTLVRIHPKPYITFHHAAFLGHRNLCDFEFMRRFMDCMFLHTFVSERGIPWRNCDIFDEIYCLYGDQVLQERDDNSKISLHIKLLAEKLFKNENPSSNTNYVQKIPQPAEGAMTRIHQPIFPELDKELVTQNIMRGVETFRIEQTYMPNPGCPKFLVPSTKKLSVCDGNTKGRTLLTPSARKLGVLRNCIASIFENKISDAKKTFPAVISTLKSKQARIALCNELNVRKGDKVQILLDHQQFDMIVRLMNAALQDNSDMDEYGIAYSILPLATTFGRKLSQGVIQFAYTLIQSHAVWQNLQFWEASFFSDVQKGIKTLYIGMADLNSNESQNNKSVKSIVNKSILEITADEIRNWEGLDDHNKEVRIEAEEKTVYSQVLGYINNMIYMMCPLELGSFKRNGKRIGDEYENASTSISNSMAESDSIDAESGFEEQDPPDTDQQVIKSVIRFADKVCSESHISEDQIKNICSNVPTTVALHLNELEAVLNQVNRLPPIQKLKINYPSLLPGEEFVIRDGLRVYLIPDGRTDRFCTSQEFLPAEGALFLTTYRVIFKGAPIDPFAAEHDVTRFFPVTSITREKRFSLNEYLTEIEQHLKEGIQIRSNTFQLIRAAFDDEVTSEDIENFRKALQRIQYPEHVLQFFAFRGICFFSQQPEKDKDKGKYATIKGFANKTLKNVTKVTNKKRKTSKYLPPNMMPTNGRFSIPEIYQESPFNRVNENDEPIDAGKDLTLPFTPTTVNSTKSLERLTERSYFKDWIRLGIISSDYNINFKGQHYDSIRVSTVNHRYNIVPSYPALLLIPSRMTDDFLKRYIRCHKHGRFPTITWRHPNNKALLLRGAGYHGRGVLGMIRRHHQEGHSHGTGGQIDVSSSVDAEKYISSIIQVTPRALLKPEVFINRSGSELSINSMVITSSGNQENSNSLNGGDTVGSVYYPTLTPSMNRKSNPFSKAMDTLTRNQGAPIFSKLSLSNMKANKTFGSQGSLASTSAFGSRTSYRNNSDGDSYSNTSRNFLKTTSLYVFGDKNQMKGVKLEANNKTQFIPVEYPDARRIRGSFKKMVRACVPSTKSNNPENTYLKQIESSEWLVFLQTVLRLSGAVVDLIDLQCASVCLCLEDGWDVSSQISSIATLCLDPYYRTIKGFRVLIEKEWLAYGHRFNHRSNLSNPNQDYGFTPVFLQFLDIVHQILNQFPTAFEFNDFYLRFLAYHHTSCRFRTFLLDNEMQRSEIGFLAVEDKIGSIQKYNYKNSLSNPGDGGHLSSDDDFPQQPNNKNVNSNSIGVNIFDYIEFHANQRPIFYNFTYAPDLSDSVLRPYSQITALHIWDYYTTEELRHGPAYDLEIYNLDQNQEEEYSVIDASLTSTGSVCAHKESLASSYDSMINSAPSAFSYLIQDLNLVTGELKLPSRNWILNWNKVNLTTLKLQKSPMIPLSWDNSSNKLKQQGRLLHKRNTMEILLRGKVAINPHSSIHGEGELAKQTGYSLSHKFEKHNYSTPTPCDVCGNLLWGMVRTGLKCNDCGYNCHDKCRANVIKSCSRNSKTSASILPRDSTSEKLENIPYRNRDLDNAMENATLGSEIIDDDDDIFTPVVTDVNSKIVHQGYLYKQANFRIKGWKPRWFVLDATKHQLRYCDTRDDFRCKGQIDLSEVIRVMEDAPMPAAAAPKKSEEGCFFDLITHKRNYCFCAENKERAKEWVQKIQSCLSSE